MKLILKVLLGLFVFVSVMFGGLFSSVDEDLIEAVQKSNYNDAKNAIDKGANVNYVDKGKQTPLHKAAYKNNIEIAKLLIEKGANVNVKDNASFAPPLYFATGANISCMGNIDFVRLLLENGADVNASTLFADTPLMLAAGKPNLSLAKYYGVEPNKGNFEILKLLVEKGADVNAIDKSGNTALSYAIKHFDENASIFLLKNNAEYKIKYSEGQDPLGLALSTGMRTVINLIPENEIEKSYYDSFLLYLSKQDNNATRQDDNNKAQKLLKNGANVNFKDEKERTPLMFSVWLDNNELSNILIANGADDCKSAAELKSKLDNEAYIETGKKVGRVLLNVGIAAGSIALGAKANSAGVNAGDMVGRNTAIAGIDTYETLKNSNEINNFDMREMAGKLQAYCEQKYSLK